MVAAGGRPADGPVDRFLNRRRVDVFPEVDKGKGLRAPAMRPLLGPETATAAPIGPRADVGSGLDMFLDAQ